MNPGKQHWATDITARIVLMAVRLRYTLTFLERVLGIEHGIASIQITFTVEARPPTLAESLENYRPLCVRSVVAGHQDFYLRRHVLVDVCDLRPHISRVNQVGAIQHECHGSVRLRSVRG